MLFNSFAFVVFACCFFPIWRLLRDRLRPRLAFLTLASFAFYGAWDWRYVFLLVYTGLIDFAAGIAMERRPERKRLWLALSLVGNVGSLLIFKYSGFAARAANALLGLAHAPLSVPVYDLILPVGISFYTFESLSYTIDVYQGKVKPTRDLVQFFAFLSMFPHLVAGPVIRPYDLLPQILANRKPTADQVWEGTRLIIHGLFKKMVIADQLAPAVNAAYNQALIPQSAPYWWVIATMFSLQIYCDFSGYTDIARGLAKWMGYDFPLNFNHPYISRSMREFWTRWHISLSTWFRDYVYLPLGGSHKGAWAAHRNMWITMLVSGLWHGAGWHFIAWGAVHALYTSVERVTRWPERLARMRWGRLAATLICIVLVNIAYVLFRAPTLGKAVSVLAVMLNPAHSTWAPVAAISLPAAIAGLLAIGRETYHYHGWGDLACWRSNAMRALEPVYLALILAMCVFLRGPGAAFIYFQF